MNNYIKKDRIKRNSSIELLKIIAIICITISHSLPVYGNQESIAFIKLGIASSNIDIIILNCLKTLGFIGNIIFIVCSAYFLLDSKKTNNEKVFNMITDCFCISMFGLLLTFLFKIKITKTDLLKQFMPITFQNNWFIGCYILFYMIHPILNKIIKSLNQKQLLRLNMIFIVLYMVINFIINDKFYYNQLVGFIVIYFMVAYVKLYLKKFSENQALNICVMIIMIILNIMLVVGTNYLGLNIYYFHDKVLHWDKTLLNPLYVILGITLLNIFNSKKFYNSFINYISSLSLLYYIIHENMLFSDYIKPIFYEYVFQYGHILAWIFVEAFILFVVGMIIAMIYNKFLQKRLHLLMNKIYYILRININKIENKLLEFH